MKRTKIVSIAIAILFVAGCSSGSVKEAAPTTTENSDVTGGIEGVDVEAVEETTTTRVPLPETTVTPTTISDGDLMADWATRNGGTIFKDLDHYLESIAYSNSDYEMTEACRGLFTSVQAAWEVEPIPVASVDEHWENMLFSFGRGAQECSYGNFDGAIPWFEDGYDSMEATSDAIDAAQQGSY